MREQDEEEQRRLGREEDEVDRHLFRVREHDDQGVDDGDDARRIRGVQGRRRLCSSGRFWRGTLLTRRMLSASSAAVGRSTSRGWGGGWRPPARRRSGTWGRACRRQRAETLAAEVAIIAG